MAISLSLLVGLVANEFVDDPLINGGHGQARYEAVPKNVEPVKHLPFRSGEGAPQVVVNLVPGEW